MSVRALKAYIWLVNLLILLGILGVAYLFFTKTLGSSPAFENELKGIVKNAEKTNAGAVKEEARIDQYDAICKFPLFFHPKAEDVEPRPITDPNSPPPLTDHFELRCVTSDRVVLWIKNVSRSVRMGNEDYFGPGEEIVRVGEAVPGVIPKAILISTRPLEIPAKATFRYNNKDETIALSGFEITGLVSGINEEGREGEGLFRGPSGQARKRRGMPLESLEPAERDRGVAGGGNSWQITKEEMELLKDKDRVSEIQSKISTKPYYDPKTRNKKGIEITSIEPGSIFEQKGLQPGDIVLSVNGTPVSSEAALIEYVKKNWERYTTFHVQVLRNGKIITLTYKR